MLPQGLNMDSYSISVYNQDPRMGASGRTPGPDSGAPPPGRCLFWCLFRVILRCPFWRPGGSPQGPQKGQKSIQKRSGDHTPQKHQIMMIFSTLECASSAVNNIKINDFHVWILTPCWAPFGRSFGSPNGGKSHQRTIPKNRQKHDS